MNDTNYRIRPGTEVWRAGRTLTLYPGSEGTYRALDAQSGTSELFSHRETVNLVRGPGVSVQNASVTDTAASARIRDGGFYHLASLTDALQEQVEFRYALCLGIQALAEKGVKISATNLDRPENRQAIIAVASHHFRAKRIADSARGGSIKAVAIMPGGRTLCNYERRFRESGYDKMSLPDHAWKRGNRRQLPLRTREFMEQAIEEAYLDRRIPTPAEVRRRLRTLITEENPIRSANGLPLLVVPTDPTVRRHIGRLPLIAQQFARYGETWVKNNRVRGTSDVRALMIGELVQIDECKISLIVAVKEKGVWERLSEDEKRIVKEIDDLIRKRIWLLVMIDVATRMPLAWVLTDAPSAESTLELLRMATRDKSREKRIYRCESDPMPAVGIGCIQSDNGTGIRNAQVKEAALGIGAQVTDLRAYLGFEKGPMERLFGTMESELFQMIHGYTGRKAGHLPGYDPIKSGVLDVRELYGIVTRYLVDEYPSEIRFSTTHYRVRPAQVVSQVNRDYGTMIPPADQNRRIYLGWRGEATVTDNGVKVFGLPFNSAELQELRENFGSKATVYVDPDDISRATVLLEGYAFPVLVTLSMTALKDLTLPQYLEIAFQARAEAPEETVLYEERLARVRRERYDQLERVASERKVPRSFMTAEEARSGARHVLIGMHGEPRPRLPGTTAPGAVSKDGPSEGIRPVGSGYAEPIDQDVSAGSNHPSGDPQHFAEPETKGKLT